jgi:hypothetical protein
MYWHPDKHSLPCMIIAGERGQKLAKKEASAVQKDPAAAS